MRLLTHNLGWKLFSLFIAFIVWNTYHIRGSLDIGESLFDDSASKEFFGYQPRILSRQGIASHYELQPREISISIRGPEGLLEPLSYRDISAFVDIDAFNPSAATNLLRVNVTVPTGVRLVRYSPSNVLVRAVIPTNQISATNNP